MATGDEFATELAGLLQRTFVVDEHIRIDAEKQLKKYEEQPGYLSGLFQLIAFMDGVPAEIRLSGSIYLKNMVRRSWDQNRAGLDGVSGSILRLDEAEKKVVRDNLLEALVRVNTDQKVREQLAETLKSIVMVDFPHNWPNLINLVMENLRMADDLRVLSALITLRNIAKVYEFKTMDKSDSGKDPREPLNTVVEVCFPHLLTLNASLEERLVNSGGMDETAHMLQRYVCKTFWSATQIALPPYILNSKDNFRMWMETLVITLRRPVPAEVMQGKLDPEELQQIPAWKVKKWLGHIMHRYFQRYGDPKRVDRHMEGEPALKEFASTFLNEYAAPITSAMLEVLSWPRTHGTPLSPRVANLALNYIDAAIIPAVTYNVIRPNVEVLLIEIVFPYLCLNDSDAMLWTEDPIEYVRKAYDVLEDFYSPRAAACNVVFTLGKLRAKKTIMPFLGHLANILNAYASAPDGSEKKEQLARQKDGVLLAIGHVKEKLLAKEDLRGNLETILRGHVQPEFHSAYPFLRARVCWLFGQLASTDSEIMSSQSILMPALEGVLRCLNDTDFPVRVQAAVDIRYFLSNKNATIAIKPVLQELFEHLFKLIDEVDNTDIITTIEALVHGFHAEIPQYASALCAKLTSAYLRAASAGEDDEESSLAAVQCLLAIETILQSLAQHRGNTQLFQVIEPVLAQVFAVMFDVDKMEFFEESLDVLSTFIYFSAEQHGVSPYLWTIYPKIFEAFDKWAFNDAQHLIVPLDNYISLGTETFLTGQHEGVPYLECVLSMIDRLWHASFDDEDAKEGAKLTEIVILNCKGRIDTAISRLLEMILRRMRIAETDQLRVRLLSNIACALYYNPGLTLSILAQLGCVQDVFTAWLGNLREFTRVHDKKSSVIGLSSILLVAPDALPAEVRNGYQQIVMATLDLLNMIHDQRRGRDPQNEGLGVPNSLDLMRNRGGGSDADFEDAEDAVDGLTDLMRSSDYVDGEDGFESEDEGEFETPLDNVDETIYFAEAVNSMGEEAAAAMIAQLPPEHRISMYNFLQRAERWRAEQRLHGH